ncbi:hypothetical protein C8Q80DRAFT_1267406 [Daedaleopsis nitida]|nr:hypothetical protein C8Q80DRAFT_1267406 [Daedaleopsis nitida]
MPLGLLDIPIELFLHILGFISNDIASLKSCSLTCKGLHPLAQYHLLSDVNISSLIQIAEVNHARIREYITTLRIYPVTRVPPAERDRYITIARDLPKLRTLVLLYLSPYSVVFDSVLQHRLSEFVSVTALALHDTNHLALHHLQHLIVSLPNLRHLTLVNIQLSTDEPSIMSAKARRLLAHAPASTQALPKQRPQLLSLRISPSWGTPESDGASAVLNWLPSTPSAQSLHTLVVPDSAPNPMAALESAMSPTIRHLSLSVRLGAVRVADIAFISRYTGLQTLDVHSVTYSSDCWLRVYRLLDHLRAPALRSLTLHYDAKYNPNDALLIDGQLLHPTGRLIQEKLPKLERACLVVWHHGRLGSQTRLDELRLYFRTHLSCLDVAGKLDVQFDPYVAA